MKIVAKPIELDAVRYDGTNEDEIIEFTQYHDYGVADYNGEKLVLYNLPQGLVGYSWTIKIGDYVIRKWNRGYSVSPEKFNEQYAIVEEDVK